MHLIFIRHGDPDYKNNTLTEKGWREAELLGRRVSGWKVDKVYVSPYGRAQDTAKPFLEKMKISAETLPWLKEFDKRIEDPLDGRMRICWDWLPREYFGQKRFFDRFAWSGHKAMKKAGIAEEYRMVCDGFDKVLESLGYKRTDAKIPVYKCTPHLTSEEAAVDTHLNSLQTSLDDRNILFVCHLGVMFVILSHLLGISPVQLWQGFFVPPTSVTVAGAEERVPGEVVFRVQQLGDASHLAANGEPVSSSGFFGGCFEPR